MTREIIQNEATRRHVINADTVSDSITESLQEGVLLVSEDDHGFLCSL